MCGEGNWLNRSRLKLLEGIEERVQCHTNCARSQWTCVVSGWNKKDTFFCVHFGFECVFVWLVVSWNEMQQQKCVCFLSCIIYRRNIDCGCRCQQCNGHVLHVRVCVNGPPTEQMPRKSEWNCWWRCWSHCCWRCIFDSSHSEWMVDGANVCEAVTVTRRRRRISKRREHRCSAMWGKNNFVFQLLSGLRRRRRQRIRQMQIEFLLPIRIGRRWVCTSNTTNTLRIEAVVTIVASRFENFICFRFFFVRRLDSVAVWVRAIVHCCSTGRTASFRRLFRNLMPKSIQSPNAYANCEFETNIEINLSFAVSAIRLKGKILWIKLWIYCSQSKPTVDHVFPAHVIR